MTKYIFFLNTSTVALTGYASISLVLRKIGVLKYIELIDQLKLTIL